MLRSTRTALLACALVAGLAACSGGSSKAGSATTPSTRSSTTTLTAAQAKNLAQAGILRSTDVPGYTAKPAKHDASDERTEAITQQCLGVPAPHYLARNFGLQFMQGDAEIDSSADVVGSASEAQTQLAAITGPKSKGCLRKSLDALVASSGGTVRSFTAKQLPVNIEGADAAFVYQFDLQADVNGQSLALSGYEIGTLVGQAEVDVQGTDIGGQGPTLAQVEHLAQLATSRERAAQQAGG